jgi:hypothetical protein
MVADRYQLFNHSIVADVQSGFESKIANGRGAGAEARHERLSHYSAKEFPMSEQSPQKDPAPATPGPAAPVRAPDEDLSQKIERAVDREPLDLVKCVRVFGNYYRCNWWSRAGGAHTRTGFDLTGVIADSIRKSSFLSATMNAGELIMKEIGPIGPQRKNLVR